MNNNIPKLFAGVPAAKLKEESQKMLSCVCSEISRHKGDWTNDEVEKLATDVYSYFVQKVIAEHGIIVAVKD